MSANDGSASALSLLFYAFVYASAGCILVCVAWDWWATRQRRKVKAWMDRETAAREAETARTRSTVVFTAMKRKS